MSGPVHRINCNGVYLSLSDQQHLKPGPGVDITPYTIMGHQMAFSCANKTLTLNPTRPPARGQGPGCTCIILSFHKKERRDSLLIPQTVTGRFCQMRDLLVGSSVPSLSRKYKQTRYDITRPISNPTFSRLFNTLYRIRTAIRCTEAGVA